VELYLHSSNTPSWRGAQLRKNTGTTLPFYTLTSYFVKIHFNIILTVNPYVSRIVPFLQGFQLKLWRNDYWWWDYKKKLTYVHTILGYREGFTQQLGYSLLRKRNQYYR